MKVFYERYKHAIPLIIYAFIYCTWFIYLEKTVTHPSRIIHMKLDDAIPFCEVFVIPYFLWFAYVSAVVLYCFFKNRQEYYKCCAFLFTGMTIFLIISTLWPNGHHLRPYVMPRDNIFTQMVAHLYKADTPTNLWPSIHVSTVFIKQHSMFDVLTAFVLSAVMYVIVYQADVISSYRSHRSETKRRRLRGA